LQKPFWYLVLEGCFSGTLKRFFDFDSYLLKLTDLGLNINHNCSFALLKDRLIVNVIGWFVILNEVKNLFLQRRTLFSFVGRMLRFAQRDSKNRSV
jgi:hypothetical protein